jgi:hypothetical protein
MMQAVSGTMAKQKRILSSNMEEGRRPGRVQYLGGRVKQVGEDPQAYLVEMDANSILKPHFHQVDQFQVIVSGSGSFGRNEVAPLVLHYADHHTAYGPINSGPCGLSYFTIRARSDPGGIWMHRPDAKELIDRPTKRRHLLPRMVGISTEPVMASRAAPVLENLIVDGTDCTDGLGAFMLRMGSGQKTTGTDPSITGGQFYLVVNGDMQINGGRFEAWSTVFLQSNDAPLEVVAGINGVEALVMNFPRVDH